MRKPKIFSFIIDNLTPVTAEKLKTALQSVDSIMGVKTSPTAGILEIQAIKNVDAEVKIACEFAGVTVRTKLKKRGLFA